MVRRDRNCLRLIQTKQWRVMQVRLLSVWFLIPLKNVMRTILVSIHQFLVEAMLAVRFAGVAKFLLNREWTY